MSKKDISMSEFCKELNNYDFVVFDKSELQHPEVSEFIELYAHKIPSLEFDLGEYHFCVNINNYENYIKYYKCISEKTWLYYNMGSVDSSLEELVRNINSDKIHGKCFDLKNINVINRLGGIVGTNFIRNKKEKDSVDFKFGEIKKLLNL